jgi:hypothetical protein
MWRMTGGGRIARALTGGVLLTGGALWLFLSAYETADTIWPGLLALLILAAVVFHKRTFGANPFAPSRRMAAFLSAALLHFLPGVVCWTLAVVLAGRTVLPVLASAWGQIAVLAGVLVLADLLVRNEMAAFRAENQRP